jgi:hypothetical protein
VALKTLADLMPLPVEKFTVTDTGISMEFNVHLSSDGPVRRLNPDTPVISQTEMSEILAKHYDRNTSPNP